MQTRAKKTPSKTSNREDVLNSIKFGKKCLRGNLESVVRKLQSKHNCDVKLSVTPDFELVGIFIQDDEMKRMFKTFPEIVIVKTTHEFSDLNIPIFTLLVEDGCGLSEIVAAGVFVLNDKATFQWFFETFEENNPSSNKIRILVWDTELAERENIKGLFDSAFQTLSAALILETFNQKLIRHEMGVKFSERNNYRKIFRNLCYSSSEAEYRQSYETFKTNAPKKLRQYFKNNWHRNRFEWMVGLLFGAGNFVDKSHDRLKNFNVKMKNNLSSFNSLNEFVNRLFEILQLIRDEGNKLAANHIERFDSMCCENESAESKYSNLLTPYAFMFILHQLTLSSDIDLVECSNGYTLPSANKLLVTENKCNCLFFRNLALPCKHILALKQKLKLLTFDAKLCGLRWHRHYYCKSRKGISDKSEEMSDLPTTDVVCEQSSPKEPEEPPLLMNDKFRDASVISTKIAMLVLESSSDVDFETKLKFLESLFHNWNNGKKVKVQEKVVKQKNQSNKTDSLSKLRKVHNVSENDTEIPMDVETDNSNRIDDDDDDMIINDEHVMIVDRECVVDAVEVEIK